MPFIKGYNVAVLGATGLVGRTVLKVLEEYNFPINNLVLFASIKSLDKEIIFKGKSYRVKQISEENIKDIDFAFLCVNEDISYKWAKKFEENNAIVIDNSKAYRMDDSCALIVPEVNIDEYFSKRKIISNPNCSTIQTVILLNALKKSLMDSSPMVRINAIEAIMNSDDEDSIELIRPCLFDDDDEVKKNALIALYNLLGREILDEVLSLPSYTEYLKTIAQELIDEYEGNDEE